MRMKLKSLNKSLVFGLILLTGKIFGSPHQEALYAFPDFSLPDQTSPNPYFQKTIASPIIYKHDEEISNYSRFIDFPLSLIITEGNPGILAADINAAPNPSLGTDFYNVKGSISLLDTGSATEALNQTTPVRIADSSQEILMLMSDMMGQISTRLVFTRENKKDCREQNVWYQTFGIITDKDRSGFDYSYKTNTLGFLLGGEVEYAYDEDVNFGCSLGYTRRSLKYDLFPSPSNTSNYSLFAYSTINYGLFFTDYVVGTGYNDYHSRRDIIFPFVSRRAEGEHSGWTYAGQVTLGSTIHTDCYDAIPFVRINYAQTWSRAFNESGANSIDLHNNSHIYRQIASELGLIIVNQFACKDARFRLQSKLSWKYYKPLEDNHIKASLNYTNTIEKYTYTQDTPNTVCIGINLRAQITQAIFGELYYEGEFSKHNKINGGGLRLGTLL